MQLFLLGVLLHHQALTAFWNNTERCTVTFTYPANKTFLRLDPVTRGIRCRLLLVDQRRQGSNPQPWFVGDPLDPFTHSHPHETVSLISLKNNILTTARLTETREHQCGRLLLLFFSFWNKLKLLQQFKIILLSALCINEYYALNIRSANVNRIKRADTCVFAEILMCGGCMCEGVSALVVCVLLCVLSKDTICHNLSFVPTPHQC